MRKKSFIVMLMVIFVVAFSLNCATIFEGPKEKSRRGNVMVGYVILDVLFTGIIGLIIDFSNGAIYSEKDGYSKGEIENEIKERLANGKSPVFYFTQEKSFAVTMPGTELIYMEIEKDSLPPNLLRSVEDRMTDPGNKIVGEK